MDNIDFCCDRFCWGCDVDVDFVDVNFIGVRVMNFVKSFDECVLISVIFFE